jgi:hypothetical protein
LLPFFAAKRKFKFQTEQDFFCGFWAVGHKMLADTTKFIGVNEKCLKGEMVERKQLVEKMILNSGRGQICARKKVLLGFPFTPAQHLSFICPFFPSILSLYKAMNEWVH